MSNYHRREAYGDADQKERFAVGPIKDLGEMMSQEFNSICDHLIEPICGQFTWEGTPDKVRQYAAERLLDKYMAMLQPMLIAEKHIKEGLEYKEKYEKLNHEYAMNWVEEEAKLQARTQHYLEINREKRAAKRAAAEKKEDAE